MTSERDNGRSGATDALRAELAANSLFRHFTPADGDRLLACAWHLSFGVDEVLVRTGGTDLDLYVVLAGRLRAQRPTPFGPMVLGEIGAGDLFGEVAFLDRKPRSADVHGLEDGRLLALPAHDVSSLCAEHRSFDQALHWAVWKSLSGKLRRTDERVGEMFATEGVAPVLAATGVGPSPGRAFSLPRQQKEAIFRGLGLSSMEARFLSSLAREERFAPDEIIFREGDVGERLYLVVEGAVRISKEIPGSGEEALAILESGDLFGEMALIDELPRSADARAHEGGAVVVAIPGEAVRNLLDLRKASSVPLLKLLCGRVAQRLRDLDDKLAGWFALTGGHLDSGFAGHGLDL